jgi:hypothetical protein
MPKALEQMNIQRPHVSSDITGTTGLAMVEAVLAGERHPKQLARRRDPRMVASEETVAAARLGGYRPEHLLVRRQSLQAYRQYQAWMADGDREIERLLAKLESRLAPGQKLLSPPKDRPQPRRNEPRFDLRAYLYRIFGVDLTAVPGVNSLTAHTLWSEVGPDLPKFPHAAALASGRGRCPDNRISGGQILSGRTRQVVNLDFSPRGDAFLGGLPEGRGFSPAEIAAPALCLSRDPRSLQPQAARVAGHGNNQKGLVTAGLKPRPSKPVVRNPG